MSVDDAERLRAELVHHLVRTGWIRTSAWVDAFRSVPRDLIVPRGFRLTADGQRYEAVDRGDSDWAAFANSNVVLTTQLDGDDARWAAARESGPVQGVATSSSSQPSLMASMLEALDVSEGQRVLEVGTGTGYNTALLCHRLGDELVTSVEIDAGVAGQARQALARLGHHPTLLVGDGDAGAPGASGFDRLVATYAVDSIPPAWLAQVRPGGVVVTGLRHDLDVGMVVALVVDDTGGAHGHLLADNAHFMSSRPACAGRIATDDLLRTAAAQPGRPARPSRLPGPIPDEAPGWAVLAALRCPGTIRLTLARDDGAVQWLLHPDGSWAYYDDATRQVEQGGAQELWTRVEDVYDRWVRLGQPDRTRIGLAIRPGGGPWEVRVDDDRDPDASHAPGGSGR